MLTVRWILTLGLLSLCSCGGPKAGDSCNEVTCGDNKTMLRCDTGVYQAVRCPGPSGCSQSNTGSVIYVICDLNGTVNGDACTTGMAGYVLCESNTNALVCNSVSFVETKCTTACITSQADGTGGVCP
jgi:hypothetical protein